MHKINIFFNKKDLKLKAEIYIDNWSFKELK